MNNQVTISSFEITRPGQRVYFQLPIPCGAGAVSGLQITVKGWPRPWDWTGLGYPSPSAGQIKLTWQEEAGVFYSGEVDLDEGYIDDETFLGLEPVPVAFGTGLWNFAGRIGPVDIHVPNQNTVICGTYTDLVNRLSVSPHRYLVRIYLLFSSKSSEL